MLIVIRGPEDKPKKPRAPRITRHFAFHWDERTGQPISRFWVWWKSARFLGETKALGYRQRPENLFRTAHVRYWGVGPDWVVLLTHPQNGQAKVLSVWSMAWYEDWWAQAIANTPATELDPASEASSV